MNASTYQNISSNPYAPPQANVYTPTDNHVKYDGKLLSVTHPAVLPNLCIKCGEACDEKQKTKKLSWVNPWWILSFILIGFFYFVIHLLVAKRLTVSYSLCPEHKAKEKKKNIIQWSVFFLSAVFMTIGNILTNQGLSIGSGLFVAGLFIFFISMLLTLFIPRVIVIKKAKHTKNLQSKRPYVFFLGGIDKRFADKAKINQATEIKV